MTPAKENVPEHWKEPIGNWRQQPEDEGPEATRGFWWPTGNPMMGHGFGPWENFRGDNPQEDTLPEGFERIFGPKPRTWAEQAKWRRNLELFDGLERPDWITDQAFTRANVVWKFWKMGQATCFKRTNDGYWLAFPDAEQLPGYIHGAQLVFGGLHKSGDQKVVVSYQIDAYLSTGVVPEPRHAMFPEVLLGGE